MPMNLANYPHNWKAFSYQIRFGRANGQCECTGQCAMHTPNPLPRRCTERHGQRATWAKGKITLTVAHLCDCAPPCVNPSHVIAACQRCHLRIDTALHVLHRAQGRHPDQLPLLTDAGEPANVGVPDLQPTSTSERSI